ncbi:hypothetical protein ABPG73_010202 [Tetrahymena malaccensis]
MQNSQTQIEIQKLLDQLRKARFPESERITQDLQQLFLKNNTYNDEIYQSLQKLISSSDPNEKYNGLIGLESISFVVQENQYINFWNKFYQLVLEQFQLMQEEKLLKKNTEVFGRLLRLGGQRVQNVLVGYISNIIEMLFLTTTKDNQKYASLLVLKELLEQSPFITFKIIANTENFRSKIWSHIKSKNILVREAALSFFDQYMQHISHKEQEVQEKEYSAYYTDIEGYLKQKEEEMIIGNIAVLKIIFSYPSQEQFTETQYSNMCKYVLSKKEHTYQSIQKIVIDTLPILSKFKRQHFCENFLCETIDHIRNLIGSNKFKAPSQDLLISYYDTLDKICSSLDGSIIKKIPEEKKKLIFDEIKRVCKTIQKDLQDKKEYIPSRVTCLQNIVKVFSTKYSELIDEDNLIDDLIFNGLYPQTVEFLENIQNYKMDEMKENTSLTEENRKREKKEFSTFIQYRLLLYIITTLQKQRNVTPLTLPPVNDSQKKFQLKLRQYEDRIKGDKEISNAIQTLSTFKFKTYEKELTNFLKDNVLDYLDNKNKIIRKAAAKAGCLLCVKKGKDNLISKSVMYKILEKFMSVAVSDAEDEIRQTMLKSLNENFDQYLIEPIYLKKLFFCVNDSNLEVQQLALTTLCRLSKYNPSDIVPFLKKTLYEYISQLSYNKKRFENEKKIINLLKGLVCLIKNDTEVVKPHSMTIATILLKFLKDSTITNNMIPELLKAFSQLSALGDFQNLIDMDEIFPIFLSAMQDKSSTFKRESAVKSLVEILKNTGFVVLPYYKYPNFLEIVFSLMKNEVNTEMRYQCMRLIGCVGAIDHFFYKKVIDKIKNHSITSSFADNRILVNYIVTKSFRKRFKFMKKLIKYQQTNQSSELPFQLHKYYEDVILLFENFKQNKMLLNLASIKKSLNNQPNKFDPLQIYGSSAFLQLQSMLDQQQAISIESEILNDESRNTEKIHLTQESDDEIREMLQAPTVIQLNDQDYYTRTTIKAVLKILYDQSLNEHHELAIKTLNCIVNLLKSRTKSFLDLLIPVLCKVLEQENIREDVLNIILVIVENCGVYYKQNYLDQLLNIFLEYSQDIRYSLICLKILKVVVSFHKRNIYYKIEPIVQKVNNLIKKAHVDEEFTLRVIQIYKNLAEYLNPHLHLIIPFLCQLITQNAQLVNMQVKTEIIQLFQYLCFYCSSSIQYISLIVDSILQNIQTNKFQPLMTNSIMDTIVVFIYTYRNDFQAYLPKINQTVKSQNIHHNIYSKCIEIFLNYGNLVDVSSQIESDIALLECKRIQEQPYTLEPKDSLTRTIKTEKILKVFDTHSNQSKEDWIQWMRKTSIEMLKESPNLILSACHQLAEVYQELQVELNNISFSSVWAVLKQKEKEYIINQLDPALNFQHRDGDRAQKVPLNLLQSLLNLAEFMQHDKGGLPIKSSKLAELAQRCSAYAKSLYYRESEFEKQGIETFESLEALYKQLGQKESAQGLVQYMQKYTKYQFHSQNNFSDQLMSTSATEGNNNKSIQIQKQLANLKLSDKAHFKLKVYQLEQYFEWEKILVLMKEEEDYEVKKQVMDVAAKAAMNLGKWEELEQFAENLSDENTNDKSFWLAAVCLKSKNYEKSKVYIHESIQKLDNKVSGLVFESYNRAFESILRLQQLFEMQEILEIKIYQEKIGQMMQREGMDRHKLQIEQELKRQNLKDIWADRLRGNPKELDTWQQILSVRQIYLSKKEDLQSWLKFCKIILRNNQLQYCRRMLDQIFQEEYQDEDEAPPNYHLANFECLYRINPSNFPEICEKMENYLKNEKKIEKKQVAKMYLKMGIWMRETGEELDKQKIKKIEEYFEKSKEFKSDYYKTWHHFALLNFDVLDMMEEIDTREKLDYILNALEGFMKSISIGTSSEHKSPYLFQDCLRLLQIIFDYGDFEEVAQLFLEDFKNIDSRAWIEVVPQIIARISDSKSGVQKILHELLIHISNHHSQALIYPLTIACKSKTQIRQQAANQIISDIKTHSPVLVNEAMLISNELNRAAILLKEQWHEGIYNSMESFERFQSEKSTSSDLIKNVMELHETMTLQPESLSEISFHQNFGGIINEAEAWIQRFSITENPICIYQAFDIYSQIYQKLKPQIKKLEFVYLENVSPKLIETKNCEISIPGMYKPSRPVIKITCFQPKLEVLPSKTHPRKICIYGSDSKEYFFLLKGHEDIRQDERVMQLFGLINRLLQNNSETQKKGLSITRYSIIPLSMKTGLLGWVQNCDTLQILIRDYRKAFNVKYGAELTLMNDFNIYNMYDSSFNDYNKLPLLNKVEIFRYIMQNTLGEDLKKVLWLKSPNSEIWLERRTNYTRSLATMSIAGYILGLGDRHLSNIMLQRQTGKIVHIDFGDCFEVAMRRESLPEKVPFRLTRMLVNAMEACGIEGNYRNTCELVVKVIRENKESLIAVLEAFVYDPLFYWIVFTMSGDLDSVKSSQEKAKNGLSRVNSQLISNNSGNINSFDYKEFETEQNEDMNKLKLQKEEMKKVGDQDKLQQPQDLFNKKAVEIMDRIKKKLNGRDFKENEQLSYIDQVNKLILQATSDENICQAYIGWGPFW